jgi:hypothetical protein
MTNENKANETNNTTDESLNEEVINESNQTESSQAESSEEPKSSESTEDFSRSENKASYEQEQSQKNWQNLNVWKRGLAMLLFSFLAGFGRFIISLIALFQFVSLLFTEQPNQPLVKFGHSLNNYLYQINQFLTVNTERYPFPFADWPTSSEEKDINA